MTKAYYNDNEPYVAGWLKNLVAAGHLPKGDVDDRPIQHVQPSDLAGYTQCHFFAGIGGWPLALALAGWPADQPVWTGSCPCQPFSVAGTRRGASDERHLWPEWHRLIRECQPATVFGEQVASKDGRGWLSGVFTDMENVGYAVAGADLCAAGVGAPHIRQRLWWVARQRDAPDKWLDNAISDGRHTLRYGHHQWDDRHLADSTDTRSCAFDGVADPEHTERGTELQEHPNAHGWNGSGGCCDSGGLGHHHHPRLAQRQESEGRGAVGYTGSPVSSAGVVDRGGVWSNAILIPCLDGKARRIEPSIQPLAHGIPSRVAKLRAIGNAIVPQVAATFIQTVMCCST